MVKNVLQYLELNEKENPDKILFSEEDKNITYKDFVYNAKTIGSDINRKLNMTNKLIVIFMEKSIECLVAMMGTVYSGNFYTIIDTKSPRERIKNICDKLEPEMIIVDRKNHEKIKGYTE